MFYLCYSLENLDLSNFNTSNVTNMSFMFSSCFELQNLNISNFNTSKVKSMENMFGSVGLKNLDLSGFIINDKVNLKKMFHFSRINTLTLLDVDFNENQKDYQVFESALNLQYLYTNSNKIKKIMKKYYTIIDYDENKNLYHIEYKKRGECCNCCLY